MKSIIVFAALLSPISSYAEVIKCTFTEPFVSFTYHTATETLIEKEAVLNGARTLKDVAFQIKYAGTFLLKDKSGKVLAELKLNNKGTDHMSDAVYPYEAKYFSPMGSTESVYGGCTSTLKPVVKKAI